MSTPPRQRWAPLVGLTGGIAAGKSLAAERFRALGVPVLDADQVAREVVAPETEGLRRVVERFGRGVLRPDGTLDREALGRIVFADPEARADLEAIVPPLVAARSAERLADLRADPAVPYVVYEVPLLVEKGLHRGMDAVVVVDAPDPVRIARLRRRDGLSEEEARARLAAQASRAQRLAVADFVLDNGGTPEELAREVRRVHRALCTRLTRRCA